MPGNSQKIDKAGNLAGDDELGSKKVQRERLASGRYAVDRIPEAATEASRDTALQRAASVAEGIHRSVRTAETPEYAAISNGPQRRAARNAFSRLIRPYEEEALRDWAERNGLMSDADAFNGQWQAQGEQGGQEHKVYLASETGRVIKANNLSPYGTYLEFFQSMQLHNWLFPTAPVRHEGFIQDEGLLKPVISQPFIRARASADTGDVAKHMVNMGFGPLPNVPDAYIHDRLGIEVHDLHGENAVIERDAGVTVIDSNNYMHADSKLARLRAYYREPRQ